MAKLGNIGETCACTLYKIELMTAIRIKKKEFTL